MNKTILAGLVAVMLMGAGSAMAETTLEKVKATGSISLSYRESSMPFSYYDGDQKPVGYSADIANKVVDAVKAELKLTKLDVKLTPVTSANRITLVQNGTIDLECGSTTNNLERQKQVAFSNTFFVVNTRLLAKADGGIKDFADLAGKNVAATAGTTSERLLRTMNDEKKMGMNLASLKDHGESFMAVETGRAVAFMMDDSLLYGEIAKAKKPAEWIVTGTPQSQEAYGCMMRNGDPEFKTLVDKTIAKLETSGEMAKIYDKWFLQPIPPKGLVVNMPLSPENKALFKAPNDKAYQ